MDVSGWTIEQRMRLPDWCFGQRKMVSIIEGATGPGVFDWEISEMALPQEICIWEVGFYPRAIDDRSSYFRLGFRATVPTNSAEMDTSIPVLPNFGVATYQPPRIHMSSGGLEVWRVVTRKGMDTGGLKLVMEFYAATGELYLMASIVYSELPTSMAGWLAHNPV